MSISRKSLRLTLPVLLFLFVLAQTVYAAIIIPDGASNAFIQTSGRNALRQNGDYRTAATGDDQPHSIEIGVACTPGQTYVFQIFDPSSDAAGNPPGLAPDGTPRVLDEIRPNAGPVPDETTFTLFSPAGAALATNTYLPGTFDQVWDTIYIAVGIAGTPGVDCGSYRLEIVVGDGTAVAANNNDENGWRFRLAGGAAPPGEIFNPLVGPDGLAGTGDESWLGLRDVSYQHEAAGPQNFFWFIGAGTTDMRILNFDMDEPPAGNPAISANYLSPGGATITGTASGQDSWNNPAPAAQNPRPTFAQMDPFDVAGGDLVGDGAAVPEPGLWRATLAVQDGQNQYSFEVPGALIFLTPPPLPNVEITKFDGIAVVTSPGQNTYTIRIENTGPGAAMPLPGGGVEVVDQLPAGMTFVSCLVNAPLVGTCAAGPGNTIEFQLGPQAGILAYLPGILSGRQTFGTMTVTVDIAPGLPNGTTLVNTATVDYTDPFGNDHPPKSAQDPDTTGLVPGPGPTNTPGGGGPPTTPSVIIKADPIITKSVNPPFALPGQNVTWTITVTNPGTVPVNNVVVSDSMPSQIQIISVRSTGGVVTVNGQQVTINIGTLNPGQTITTTIDGQVRNNVGVPFVITNVATLTADGFLMDASADLLSAARLPATGESPWSAVRIPLLALGALGIGAAGYGLLRRRKASAGG